MDRVILNQGVDLKKESGRLLYILLKGYNKPSDPSKEITAVYEDGHKEVLSSPISIDANHIATVNGNPVKLYTEGEYSITITDSFGKNLLYVV